jgi:hypothetical protein
MPGLLRLPRRGGRDLREIRPRLCGRGQKRISALEPTVKPDFIVILNEVKDLKS